MHIALERPPGNKNIKE